MSTPIVIERIVALEPTARDDFADPPTNAPAEAPRARVAAAGILLSARVISG